MHELYGSHMKHRCSNSSVDILSAPTSDVVLKQPEIEKKKNKGGVGEGEKVIDRNEDDMVRNSMSQCIREIMRFQKRMQQD